MSLSNLKEYLNRISEEDVIKAMALLDKTDIPPNRQSIAYDVLNQDSDTTYPPPLLIEYAYKISNSDSLPKGFFDKIGKDSPHFKKLSDLGFKITTKNENTMGNLKAIFKKVPSNEVGSGTEISILKTYFNKNIIDDPKDFAGADDNEGSKSFPVNVTFNNHRYVYPIRAYKTSNYKKDRRLILNKSNDPLGLIRKPDDYLCMVFEDKISRDSEIEIFVINSANPLYKKINELYASRNGLILEESKNSDLLNLILGNKMNPIANNQPLNQILYGPPGTGKTYSTITKALNIIGLLEEKDIYTNEEYAKAQVLFQNELGKRIEFVTMHQSFSYEDFVQGLKPEKPKEGKGISFEYKNGVFKEICRRANLKNKEYDDFQKGKSKVDFDLVIEFAFKDLIENDEPVTIKNGNSPFKIHALNDKTLWFETSKGTRHDRYTLAKKTLKEIYEKGANKIITSGNKGYFDAALVFLNKKSEELQENFKTKLKPDDNRNFVIILDEINRANISRVFGELIALIEKDKRDGKLKATLPSGEPFTVPSNLYIIGTMNTADKSIALVDIALRRRFEFTALYPDTKILKTVLVENKFEANDIEERVNMLTRLNRIIRSKKSVDFEIGHSYFMEADSLINILNKQVLPLLNEYFMYDLKKVKDIIKKQQKDREGNLIPNLGITLNEVIWSDRGLLEVEKIEIFENLQMVAEADEKYGNL